MQGVITCFISIYYNFQSLWYDPTGYYNICDYNIIPASTLINGTRLAKIELQVVGAGVIKMNGHITNVDSQYFSDFMANREDPDQTKNRRRLI